MIQIKRVCMSSAVPLVGPSSFCPPGEEDTEGSPFPEGRTRISGGGGWTQEDGKHGRLWGLLGLN